MIFDKNYVLTKDTIRHYPDACIQWFEFNEQGVILHYAKNYVAYSLGAKTLEYALMQWNNGMI